MIYLFIFPLLTNKFRGWNNIRMAMETVLVMAHAMGRTLVLPPQQKMYLLHNVRYFQVNAFMIDFYLSMFSFLCELNHLYIYIYIYIYYMYIFQCSTFVLQHNA